jgi:hypothetical protein
MHLTRDRSARTEDFDMEEGNHVRPLLGNKDIIKGHYKCKAPAKPGRSNKNFSNNTSHHLSDACPSRRISTPNPHSYIPTQHLFPSLHIPKPSPLITPSVIHLLSWYIPKPVCSAQPHNYTLYPHSISQVTSCNTQHSIVDI